MVMKQHRKPKKDLKVTVTFSESDGPIAHSSHGEIPSVNIVVIRSKTGLSQSTFAARIGVPEGTLRNWEQGRRQPSGPAKVLLALLAKKPDLVAELYPATQRIPRWSSSGLDPNAMTAAERLAEVGQILAAGIIRMRSSPQLAGPAVPNSVAPPGAKSHRLPL